jgi:AraC-like DNA-binding protein
LAALGIQYAGVTHAEAGFSFCRREPQFAVVFGTIQGEGRVWLNRKWRKCAANDIFLTQAGVPHAYHAVKGRKWHLAWVAYDEKRGKAVIRGPQVRLRRGSAFGLCDAILGLYHEAHALKEAAAMHHWAELVDLSARRLVKERQIDERLLRLWSGIETELAKPWQLDALAVRAHVGPEQLRHLCRKFYGRSPMEHLAWLRMRRAASLLERTDQKISVVAEEVGYQNAFAFSTAFKRVIGVSPRAFSRRTRARNS